MACFVLCLGNAVSGKVTAHLLPDVISLIGTPPFPPEAQRHCIFHVVGVWLATRKKNDSLPERCSAVLSGRTVLSSRARIHSKQIQYFMF
jgi:hypothetical protein